MNKKILSLRFDVPTHLSAPLPRLQTLLGFIEGDGITVSAVQGERNGVSLHDGKATLYFTAPHFFYRELGVLIEHARISDSFDITEDSFFDTLSVMIDTARCGVNTVESIFI